MATSASAAEAPPANHSSLAVTSGQASASRARPASVPAWQAEGLRQQFGRVARRGLDGIDVRTDEVERLTGRPARTLADWARDRRTTLLG